MPKISWGEAKVILENIVRDHKDSVVVQLSNDWLYRETRDCIDDPEECQSGKHGCVKGVETDKMFYTSPYTNFVVGFIDDHPDQQWPHPCRYAFISLDGSRLVMNATLPPTSMKKYKFEQIIPSLDKRVTVVRAHVEEF